MLGKTRECFGFLAPWEGKIDNIVFKEWGNSNFVVFVNANYHKKAPQSNESQLYEEEISGCFIQKHLNQNHGSVNMKGHTDATAKLNEISCFIDFTVAEI